MQKIPKVFHQIWLGGKPLPEKFQEFQKTWKFHHPDWEMKMWNEDNINQIPGLEMTDLELCKNYAEKSDLIRFFIIRGFGGIYIDTDFECLKNIESLMQDIDCFLSKEKRVNGSSITNSILGATIQQHFIQSICDSLPQRLQETSNWGKYKSCDRIGPYFIEKLYHDCKEKNAITIFPYDFFLPIESMYSTGNTLHVNISLDSAYAIHHYSSSWISPLSMMLRYIWNMPFFGHTLYKKLIQFKRALKRN